ISPAVYVKGIDYNEQSIPETDVCNKLGIDIRYTTTEKWSSSRLINAEKFSPEVCSYLERARKADFLPRILGAFDAADKLNIAFIGETIEDNYVYVRALGKASKEPIIATVADSFESFQGGTHAA